jgi:DUF1680 family protein
VNLYVPSTLTWTEHATMLTQLTDFPYGDTTTLTVTGGGDFTVNLRVPQWATQGFFVGINGQDQAVTAEPGTYLALNRAWQDGDTIELRMPFAFHLRPVMDQPNLASLFYGPILLAAEEPEARSAWRPITLNGQNLQSSISGDPHTLHFQVGETTFKPFYETYGRHSAYLDVTLE